MGGVYQELGGAKHPHGGSKVLILMMKPWASFERFLFLLRLLGLDNVDFNEGRVIDQKLANAIVADLTRLSCC